MAMERRRSTLPDWFEALNRDVRYQLTPIGEYAPVFIRSKVKAGRFSIAGGVAGQEVSWQVTGIRQDAWAEAHRIPVEEAKTGAVKGRYLTSQGAWPGCREGNQVAGGRPPGDRQSPEAPSAPGVAFAPGPGDDEPTAGLRYHHGPAPLIAWRARRA